MKHSKRIAIWLAFNGVFAAAIYFGVVEGIAGAQRIASFMIWALFALSFCLLSDEMVRNAQKEPPAASQSVNFVYDLAVLGVLVWFGWGWSAAAYAIHMVLQTRRFAKIPEPKDAAPQA